MANWSNFFLGELGAAAAFAGLLFVAVSVNQQRILSLGRMADRGLEALGMLMLVIIVASLPLVPGQSPRLLGAEILGMGSIVFLALWPLQIAYRSAIEPQYRRHSGWMVAGNRAAMLVIIGGGGLLLWRGDLVGLYLLPPGILLTFLAVGINAWVLLIEINR